jgi:SAM-dependent methyltransferase
MDHDTMSAVTHGDRPFANPLAEAAVDAALATLELPAGAHALDIGCGGGALLARLDGVRTVGIEPSAPRAATARERLDEVHEARFDEVELEPGSFDLVACVGSSHALGRWDDALRSLYDLTRPLGYAILGEGFWRRDPSPRYLEALGASADELPDLDGLEAGVIDAGWAIRRLDIASDADWASYEETLIANGERALAERFDPDLRAWVDGARARWEHVDGRDTLGFALLVLQRGERRQRVDGGDRP